MAAPLGGTADGAVVTAAGRGIHLRLSRVPAYGAAEGGGLFHRRHGGRTARLQRRRLAAAGHWPVPDRTGHLHRAVRCRRTHSMALVPAQPDGARAEHRRIRAHLLRRVLHHAVAERAEGGRRPDRARGHGGVTCRRHARGGRYARGRPRHRQGDRAGDAVHALRADVRRRARRDAQPPRQQLLRGGSTGDGDVRCVDRRGRAALRPDPTCAALHEPVEREHLHHGARADRGEHGGRGTPRRLCAAGRPAGAC